MPRRIRPPRVPLDGQPLSALEQRAARADRLGLLLAAAVIKNSVFTPQYAAIRLDAFDEAPDWLSRNLRPLREHSRLIRDFCTVLDSREWTPWDDPVKLRRIVKQIQRDIARLKPTEVITGHG